MERVRGDGSLPIRRTGSANPVPALRNLNSGLLEEINPVPTGPESSTKFPGLRRDSAWRCDCPSSMPDTVHGRPTTPPRSSPGRCRTCLKNLRLELLNQRLRVAQKRFQHPRELIAVYWLGNEAVHRCVESDLPFRARRPGPQGDNAGPGPVCLTNSPRRFVYLAQTLLAFPLPCLLSVRSPKLRNSVNRICSTLSGCPARALSVHT